jgi:transposase-like protein
MQQQETTFFAWQKRFGTEEACEQYLYEERWGKGFLCPKCGHDHAHYLRSRKSMQCIRCRHQVSLTAGTLLHSTNLPLTKWFWAIFLVVSDKGGISALRLSKLLEVSWPTAHSMLRKIRTAMGHRDSLYRLTELIEVDDAMVGGKRPGKRGRGAHGKTSVLIGCENRDKKAGFIAMEAVPSVNGETVKHFAARKLAPNSSVRTDALAALNTLGESQQHQPRVTPPDRANSWLPWVHVVTGNLKRFLLGTFHGVSGEYLQEYLDEFCYRFNRRKWEAQLPNRLLCLCVEHGPHPFRAGNC